MRLGEHLVRNGVITREQLTAALDAQLIYGGHLGTCLIEQEAISEDRLGEALSEIFGIPFVTREALHEIPLYVLHALPPRIVEKHVVIPFNLEDKRLDVAMVDPKNLQAVDEVAFATGQKIRPWIAPEIRILQAMERYYDVPRKTRYVTLCRMLDEACDRAATGSTQGDELHETGPSRPAAPAGERLLALERASSGSARAVEAPEQRQAQAVEIDSLAVVSEDLCETETARQAGRIVLDQATRELERTILFKTRHDDAEVWLTAGLGPDAARLDTVSFEMSTEPLFELVKRRDHFLGTIPRKPAYQRFYRVLRMELPAEALIVPVRDGERVVAVLYGDCGAGRKIEFGAEPYLRMAAKLACALRLVEIKRELLAL